MAAETAAKKADFAAATFPTGGVKSTGGRGPRVGVVTGVVAVGVVVVGVGVVVDDAFELNFCC